MFDHLDFAVADVAHSRAFYIEALAPLGVMPLVEIDRDDDRHGTGFGGGDGIARFWIGGGESVAGRMHVAFAAPSRAAVEAFHAAALAAGGEDHGAPGERPRYGTPYYAAFVRDPDGHVVEAVYRSSDARASQAASIDNPYAVTDAASLLAFARALAADRTASVARERVAPSSPYGPDAGGWENTTIEAFLESAIAWAEDSGFGVRQGLSPSNPWGQFAAFLHGGKIYE